MINWKKLRLVWITCLILLLYVLHSNAQIPVALEEKLEDGSWVIKIDGTEYRALPPDKMREVIKTKQERDLYETSYNSLLIEYNHFRVASDAKFSAQVERDVLQLKKSDDLVQFWKDQYQAEFKLRNKFGKDIQSCTGKIIFFRLCTF